MKGLDVIIAPLISEKSTKDVTLGRFTFKVHKSASKRDIKKAIENKFKVNVVNVSTMIIKGKKKRYGRRQIEAVGGPWKKAIVALKEGQKIDLFDVGEQLGGGK